MACSTAWWARLNGVLNLYQIDWINRLFTNFKLINIFSIKDLFPAHNIINKTRTKQYKKWQRENKTFLISYTDISKIMPQQLTLWFCTAHTIFHSTNSFSFLHTIYWSNSWLVKESMESQNNMLFWDIAIKGTIFVK